MSATARGGYDARMDDVAAFYDALADDYPSLFADWDASVRRQGEVIDGLIQAVIPGRPASILDATCGIGTQAIGLALRGHHVSATDLSARAVERARQEATRLGVEVEFGVSDVRALPGRFAVAFGAAITFDNALPHLVEPGDLRAGLQSLHGVLRPGGLLLASIRDYDAILADRPEGEPARMTGQPGRRRLVAQAWEWDDREPVYRLHQFVLREEPAEEWTTRHLETRYRALRRSELEAVAREVGFRSIRWLEPSETGYYQPIMEARRA